MTLIILKNRLEMYLEAERKILSGQEYEIGNRRLRRADLKEVRAAIEDLADEIEMLESPQGRRKAVIF